ncbi:MAG: efflux RND transporter periplasmic adaptor subunit [Candidatus Firestonebacteria bacterium]
MKTTKFSGLKKVKVFFALVFLASFLGGCSIGGGTEVKTAKAVRGELVVNVQATGTVRSNNEAKLTTVASGRVSKIFVEENEAVEKDRLLLELDSAAQADKDHQRMAALSENGFLAPQQAEQAKEQWKNTFIAAPFTGTIVKKFIEVGETLYGGMPALMLADLKDMIFESNVDETDIGQLKADQRAEVVLDAYKETRIPATIIFISKSSLEVKEKGITYQVKSRLDKSALVLRLGMTGDIYVKVDNKSDVLMVPYTAIGDDKDGKYVFVVEKDKAVKKSVKTGLESYDNTEIISGLKEGEGVIEGNISKIKDGQKVKIIQ